MADWLFLSYNNPEDARSGQTRKKIRAHVTSRQHALNRQSADEEPLARGLQQRKVSNNSYTSTPAAKPPQKKPAPKTTRSAAHAKRPTYAQQTSCWDSKAGSNALEGEKNQKKRNRSASPERPSLSSSISSPACVNLNVAPVPRKDWYDWLHDYWFNGTLIRAKGLLKVDDVQLQRYISWTRRLLVTEPAFYYMSLLLATGIPVANGQFPLVRALWLRGQTVTAINEALSDPERAISDALIQAVGQIALHEHIYGDRTAAHQVHRPAQQRMIDMRGGVKELDLPHEVKQIMVWYDRLMAAEAGNEPYFAGLADGENVKAYDNAEAIAITNNASPARYKHPGYYGSDVNEQQQEQEELGD